MKEHISGMLKRLRERWEYYAALQKYEKLLGVERDVLNSLIKLAIILHDVGKSKREYQERCIENCTSFPYHYAISARVAMQFTNLTGVKVPLIDELSSKPSYRPSLGVLYLSVVVLPILLHHYAQVTEESLIRAIRATKNINEIEIYEPCREIYMETLYTLLKYLKRPQSELTDMLEKAYEVLSESSKIKLATLPLINEYSLLKIYAKVSPLLTLVEVFTGILNICDGLVACVNREERFGLRKCG